MQRCPTQRKLWLPSAANQCQVSTTKMGTASQMVRWMSLVLKCCQRHGWLLFAHLLLARKQISSHHGLVMHSMWESINTLFICLTDFTAASGMGIDLREQLLGACENANTVLCLWHLHNLHHSSIWALVKWGNDWASFLYLLIMYSSSLWLAFYCVPHKELYLTI